MRAAAQGKLPATAGARLATGRLPGAGRALGSAGSFSHALRSHPSLLSLSALEIPPLAPCLVDLEDQTYEIITASASLGSDLCLKLVAHCLIYCACTSCQRAQSCSRKQQLYETHPKASKQLLPWSSAGVKVAVCQRDSG